MGFDLDTDTLIAVISAIGIGLTFWVVGLMLTGGGASRRYQRRLNSMQERAQGIATSEWAAARSLSRQQSTTRIDRIAGNWLPRRYLLLARLERTGRAISIGKYAMTAIGLGALSAIGFAIGTRIGIVPSLLIGLLTGTAVPHLVIGRMGKRRLARFINLFPDAIDLIVRALRSGLPISEAIVGAGHEIGDPVGSEFRLVEGGMRLGRDLETLLWDTAKRIDAPEFKFFVIALSVQRETGGNLAETLAVLAALAVLATFFAMWQVLRPNSAFERRLEQIVQRKELLRQTLLASRRGRPRANPVGLMREAVTRLNLLRSRHAAEARELLA